jgi:uncharacterized membrane protein YfcA
MPYHLQEIFLVAFVMTLGSVLQGAVGFASGLVGVPMLVLCGFSLVEATVINFISTTVQNFTGAVQLWSHIEAEDVTWPAILRCVGLPLGTLALAATPSLDQNVVKQIIGFVLLASVLMLVSLRVTPRERLSFGWIGLTFISSGFLMGFASIGGAPMVMYVNSLTWSAAKSRAFLFFCSAAIMPLMATALIWQFGEQLLKPAFLAVIVLPPCLMGLWLGLTIGARLDKARFRRLTYGLLLVVALAAILSPVVFKVG